MDIDLRRCWLPLVGELGRALDSFARRHPHVQVCTVGLWGDGFHGVATLHVDTRANSAACVEKYSRDALQDVDGRFWAGCKDFAYQVGAFKFRDYPDLYCRSDGELAFISLDGKRGVVDGSAGDAGKDQYVFPFLKRLISSLEPFPQLTHANPMRVGVEMHGSGAFEFWRLTCR